jgi:hypothetical protein
MYVGARNSCNLSSQLQPLEVRKNIKDPRWKLKQPLIRRRRRGFDFYAQLLVKVSAAQ